MPLHGERTMPMTQAMIDAEEKVQQERHRGTYYAKFAAMGVEAVRDNLANEAVITPGMQPFAQEWLAWKNAEAKEKAEAETNAARARASLAWKNAEAKEKAEAETNAARARASEALKQAAIKLQEAKTNNADSGTDEPSHDPEDGQGAGGSVSGEGNGTDETDLRSDGGSEETGAGDQHTDRT